jgi:hypothetical protein
LRAVYVTRLLQAAVFRFSHCKNAAVTCIAWADCGVRHWKVGLKMAHTHYDDGDHVVLTRPEPGGYSAMMIALAVLIVAAIVALAVLWARPWDDSSSPGPQVPGIGNQNGGGGTDSAGGTDNSGGAGGGSSDQPSDGGAAAPQ